MRISCGNLKTNYKHMKKTYLIYFFAAIITFIVSSCLVEPKFPEEPTIKPNAVLFTHHPEFDIPPLDSIGTFTIMVDFQDGNGDLGHNATLEADPIYHPTMVVVDSTGKNVTVSNPNYFNYYISLLIKNEAGEYVPFELPGGLILDGRFDRLNKDEKPKPIEGTIAYHKKVGAGLAGVISEKTVKFKVQVLDREFNRSNEILTDSVVVPKIL